MKGGDQKIQLYGEKQITSVNNSTNQQKKGGVMKKVLMILAVSIFLAATVFPVSAYHTHKGPSELLYYDASKSAGGYNLFTPNGGAKTYLIDMVGRVINTWPIPGYDKGFRIEKFAAFQENGNLLRRIKVGGHRRKGETHLQEVDWNGKVLVDIEDTRKNYLHHHAFIKIFNAALGEHTYLSIASKDLTHEEAIQAGADPKLQDDYTSRPDGIVELDKDSNVIWEWNVTDHLVQDVDPTKDNYGVVADHPEKLDINFASGRTGDWIHINSLDYNPELGYIAFHNDRNSEIWMIDHGATFKAGDPAGSIAAAAGPGGDILWRWGNPAVYDGGKGQSMSEHEGASDGDQQGFHVHDIQFIRPGLPGAGNLLQFDNGSRHIGTAYYSAILEINPYISGLAKATDKQKTGKPIVGDKLVFQPDAGYHNVRAAGSTRRTSNQVVWMYAAKENSSFYARNISGMNRHPNGNTVICSGTWGHFFEVTPKGEVVWEYKNPDSRRGIVKIIEDGDSLSVFRVYRYMPDHPAFVGKDMTPGPTITGRPPATLEQVIQDSDTVNKTRTIIERLRLQLK